MRFQSEPAGVQALMKGLRTGSWFHDVAVTNEQLIVEKHSQVGQRVAHRGLTVLSLVAARVTLSSCMRASKASSRFRSKERRLK